MMRSFFIPALSLGDWIKSQCLCFRYQQKFAKFPNELADPESLLYLLRGGNKSVIQVWIAPWIAPWMSPEGQGMLIS